LAGNRKNGLARLGEPLPDRREKEGGVFLQNGDQYLCPLESVNLWTLWNTQQGHIDAAIFEPFKQHP